MKIRSVLAGMLVLAPLAAAQGGDTWKIHDAQRPNPVAVTPGTAGQPPSDAVPLFDGSNLSQWEHAGGVAAKWKVENGYMEATKSGDLFTKKAFGDCQLHIEWATSEGGVSQGGGNSGIFFMGKYEVQVLNSYENRTYADGQAAAIYTQYPPLVNASLPPRAWQTYDIIFRAPRFGRDGALRRAANLTVFHNGVLVQDHVRLNGPTSWMEHKPYEKHAPKMPIKLQDHRNAVRYRNIWLRELGPRQTLKAGPETPRAEKAVTLTRAQMEAIAGEYASAGMDDTFARIWIEDGKLMARVREQIVRELHAASPTEFFFKEVEAPLVVELDANGNVIRATMTVGIDPKPLEKK